MRKFNTMSQAASKFTTVWGPGTKQRGRRERLKSMQAHLLFQHKIYKFLTWRAETIPHFIAETNLEDFSE